MNLAFDTHAAVKRLRQAGFTEGQAEALSETVQDGFTGGGLATKADLAPLATKAELAPLATKAELAPLATKVELTEVKNELTEVKAQLAATATKAELTEVKDELTEVKAQLAAMATKAELAEVKTELKTDLAEVKNDLVWIKRIGALAVALLAVPILRDLLG